MANDQNDMAALIQDLADRVKVLETQAPLESSSIGSGGLRVYDGGKIVFDGGNSADDIKIGVYGDQVQIRLGSTVLFSGTGYSILQRKNASGGITTHLNMDDVATSLAANGSSVVLSSGSASLRTAERQVSLDNAGVKVPLVLNTTAVAAVGIDANGYLCRYVGGTGPHPSGSWVWPFPLRAVTSEFGTRGGRFHEGIDLGNSPALNGATIHAAGPGTVETAGWHSNFGNWVVINHGNINGRTIKTVYAHMLNSPAVGSGASVTSATVIGQVGNTGASFGAHLHFETHSCSPGGGISWNNSNPSPSAPRTAVNPRTFMASVGATGG